ncbi:MAG: PIN domain-containing protein [Nitrospirae bacterium]|nr:PIN domain-containing protein [Nitrospirota bacterium]
MDKKEIVLIDTSSWIEALRSSGDKDIRGRVMQLMVDGRASWCDMVRVELWNGARGDYEKRKLSELEEEMTNLETTTEAWETARMLARKCRKAGRTVPAADLVITACALAHNSGLEHCDSHIELILKTHSHGKQK